MRLPENPTFAITKMARNRIHVRGIASAAQPSTPIIMKNVNSGFLRFLLSATAPSTGPKPATISVEIEMAELKYAVESEALMPFADAMFL